jgi:hypothetical protein
MAARNDYSENLRDRGSGFSHWAFQESGHPGEHQTHDKDEERECKEQGHDGVAADGHRHLLRASE